MPVNKMQDAVMGPPELVFGQNRIRVTGEIAIGKKHEFYQLNQRCFAGRGAVDEKRRTGGRFHGHAR